VSGALLQHVLAQLQIITNEREVQKTRPAQFATRVIALCVLRCDVVCVKWASLVLPAVLRYDAHMTMWHSAAAAGGNVTQHHKANNTTARRTLFLTMKSFVDTPHSLCNVWKRRF
jgi:hypothetical protein